MWDFKLKHVLILPLAPRKPIGVAKSAGTKKTTPAARPAASATARESPGAKVSSTELAAKDKRIQKLESEVSYNDHVI